MKKTVLILALSLLATSAMAGNNDNQIHGQAFNGNTNLPNVGNGNNNGGNLQTGGNGQGNNGVGNGNGGPFVPSVPVPGALWLFGSALVGFLAIGRNRKK